MHACRTVLWSAAAAFACAAAHGQSVVVLPAVADATLYQEISGALADGSGPGIFCGRNQRGDVRRAVARFDLGSIPPGARVLAAELTLQVSRSIWTLPLDVTVHRVTAPWSEGPSVSAGGGGTGGSALPGDTTWVHRSYPNTNWAVPGGDFDAIASAGAATPQLGVATWTSTAALVRDVQGWVDQPSTNHGWLWKTDEVQAGATRRFDSREIPAPATGPMLRVEFLTAPGYVAYAPGCAGAQGVPTNTAASPPRLGQTLSVTIGNAPAAALLFFGLSDTISSLGPLPIDLAVVQAPGCLWRTSTDIELLGASAAGSVAFAQPIPNAPAFLGLAFFTQAAVFAPGANGLGAIVSDAAIGIVGP